VSLREVFFLRWSGSREVCWCTSETNGDDSVYLWINPLDVVE